MKAAHAATLLAMVTGLVAIPFQTAAALQTGMASFYCPATAASDCAVSSSSGEPVRSSHSLFCRLPTDAVTMPCVQLFLGADARGSAGKNILVTAEVRNPDANPFAVLRIRVSFAERSPQLQLNVSIGDAPAPFVASFAFLNAASVTLDLFCIVNATGSCTQTDFVMPPNTQYTVDWQIEDPPGASGGLPISWELLAAVVLGAATSTALAAYLARGRRAPSAKPYPP